MIRALWQVGVAFLVLLLAIAAIALSPIFMQDLGNRFRVDWSKLSDVGQTYGFISAMLSAFAVIGVAASLYFQAKQTRLTRHQMTRQTHAQLLGHVMEDPATYGPAMGSFHSKDGPYLQRRLWAVLWLNYFKTMFETGEMSEKTLRFDALQPFFKGQFPRKLWAEIRPYWVEGPASATAKGRRFVKIVEAEYALSLEQELSETIEEGAAHGMNQGWPRTPRVTAARGDDRELHTNARKPRKLVAVAIVAAGASIILVRKLRANRSAP